MKSRGNIKFYSSSNSDFKNISRHLFYSLDLNLVDWSSQNHLAIALGGVLYVWNAGDGSIHQLLELSGEDLITSVSWINDGRYLAVGTDSAEVQVSCDV